MQTRHLLAVLAAAVLAVAAAQAEDGRRTYELPGDALHPEGIAYDPAGDALFVSGAGTGELLRVDRATGEVQPFGPEGGAPFSTIGLDVDAQGRLWVAGGGTGLIRAYSLADGTEEVRAETGEGGFINDLVSLASGEVFATDSQRPVLYRVAAGATEAEEWLDLEAAGFAYVEGINANGIVATAGGEYLIVAQLNEGLLWRVDVATQEVAQVQVAQTFPGADGLVLDGQTLYVVQNSEYAVAVVELDQDFAAGSVVATITDDSFRMPTTAVLVEGELIVVNAQFDRMGNEPELPFTLSVVPVGEAGE